MSFFEIGCPVNLEDPSTLQTYIDADGLHHYLQKITCPTCGIRLEIDMWKDAEGLDHQTTRIYSKSNSLILEAIE